MKMDFDETLKKLSPTIRRITWKLNGHFTFIDHDDLFQEALEHLWVAYNNGSLDNRTDSYILQGCYFHLKNYLRKTLDKAKLVSLQGLLESGGGSLEELFGYEDNHIEESANEASITDGAESKKLTVRERKVLKMSMDGLTTREIGSKLGISHVMVLKLRKNIKRRFEGFKPAEGHGYQN
jgi:RNA polymerase sigma factor (sigma-70 family)